MAYLTSTATLAEVKAQWENTTTYDLAADVTMCREHIQASRMLIARTADETRQGSSALRDNVAKYERAEKAARTWLAERDPDFAAGSAAGFVRVLSVEGLRDL